MGANELVSLMSSYGDVSANAVLKVPEYNALTYGKVSAG